MTILLLLLALPIGKQLASSRRFGTQTGFRTLQQEMRYAPKLLIFLHKLRCTFGDKAGALYTKALRCNATMAEYQFWTQDDVTSPPDSSY